MAELKKKLILEIDAQTGEVTGQLDALNKDLDATADKAADVGKKGGKGFAAMNKGLGLAKNGFKMLGKAIIATGIGALVAVVGMLIKKLSEMKPVMDVVEKATAAIGAGMKVLADVLQPVGEWMVTAFTSPSDALATLQEKLQALGDYLRTLLDATLNPLIAGFYNIKRAALEAAIGTKEFFGGDATEMKQSVADIDKKLADLAVKQQENKEVLKAPFVAAAKYIQEELVPAMLSAGKAAVDLAAKKIALRDAQRELAVEYAAEKSYIAELKKDSDDITKSISDRVAAAQLAAAEEEKYRAKRQALVEQEIALLRQEQEIQGESEERTQAIADLQVEYFAIVEEGLGLQTEMMTKVQGLELEQEQARKAFHQTMKDRAMETASEKEQELEDIATHYAEQLLLAEKYEMDTTALLEAQEAERKAVEDKYRDLAVEAEKERVAKEKQLQIDLRNAKLQAAGAVINGLMALNSAFADADGENAEKAFKRNKALGIASATINTALAISDALAKDATFPGSRFIAAAAAGMAGVAQVAAIKKQQFVAEGGGDTTIDTAAITAGAVGGGGGGATASAPELDLSFMNEGASTPVQAYVLSNDVTNSQQADQLIQDQASL